MTELRRVGDAVAVAREDPFSGKDGRALERDMINYIKDMQDAYDRGVRTGREQK